MEAANSDPVGGQIFSFQNLLLLSHVASAFCLISILFAELVLIRILTK